MRFFIDLGYNGSLFHGWQRQRNQENTIQGTIERTLVNLLQEEICVDGASRTDAGVHAIEQSAHFDCKSKINEPKRFLKSINYFLNKEGVALLKIKKKK